MRRRCTHTVLLTCLAATTLLAQEGTWQVSVSGGYARLQMSDLNSTLDKSVDQWNTITLDHEYVPIGPFEHFNWTPTATAKVSYRIERDVSIALSFTTWKRSLSNSYQDDLVLLKMERTVSATNWLLGIQYFFTPLAGGVEVFAEVDAGLIKAIADASTFNTKRVKMGADYVTNVLYDTHASYSRSKISVHAGGGATMPLAAHVLLRVEVLYTLANMGTMQGDIVRLSGTFNEPSTTMFDFSFLNASGGLTYEF